MKTLCHLKVLLKYFFWPPLFPIYFWDAPPPSPSIAFFFFFSCPSPPPNPTSPSYLIKSERTLTRLKNSLRLPVSWRDFRFFLKRIKSKNSTAKFLALFFALFIFLKAVYQSWKTFILVKQFRYRSYGSKAVKGTAKLDTPVAKWVTNNQNIFCWSS